MIIQCAWCKKTVGEKEPLSDKSLTHTICRKCSIEHWGVDPEKVKTMKNPKRPSKAKYCPERLTDPNKYDKRSFHTTVARAHRLTFGCPKGQYDVKHSVCKVPIELQRILHPVGEAKCPIPGKKMGKNPIEYGIGLEKVKVKLQNLWDFRLTKEDKINILKSTGYVKITIGGFLVSEYEKFYNRSSILDVKFKDLPLIVQDLLIGTSYKFMKNPGAKWHREEEKFYNELKKKQDLKSHAYIYFDGKEAANKYAIQKSKEFGINPKQSYYEDIEYTAVELYIQHRNIVDVATLLEHEFVIDHETAKHYAMRAGQIVRGSIKYVTPKIARLLQTNK